MEGYKAQDENADRPTTEDYVTASWIMSQYKAKPTCSYCYAGFDIDFDDDHYMTSNLSVDRIDNELPHTISNCCLACVHCNVTKK